MERITEALAADPAESAEQIGRRILRDVKPGDRSPSAP